MKRRPAFGILIMAVISFSCSQQSQVDKLSVSLDSLLSVTPDFSGVILVAKKGKPVYHKSFGQRNFETGEPMDTSAIFELASLSKQFTAMTIMMLKDEGKLNFDDSLSQFIPELPYHGITIRHLLHHTSGLPDYQSIMDQHWDKSKIAGNTDNIEYLVRYHPPALFPPGEKYEYSNTGYMLLASITEKVSGHHFIAFCKTRIFVPLKMTSTDIRTQEEKSMIPNMAWGHIYVSEKSKYVRTDSFPQFNYTIWLGNRVGPGRVSSTSHDLLKWDRALYEENLVKSETLEEGFQSAILNNGSLSNYGFGFRLEKHPLLGRVVRHAGDNPGYKTQIIRYIDRDQTIIILSNADLAGFDSLTATIEKIMESPSNLPDADGV